MSAYIYSASGCFAGGALGATTFLFMTLLFDKKVTVLDNDLIARRTMGLLYVVLGGIVAAIVSVSAQFDPDQLRVAFAAGLAWPAVATGIGAGRQIGELSQEKEEVRQTALAIESRASEEKDEIADYYRRRLDRASEYLSTVLEGAERQQEEMRAFYVQRIESLGGEA